MIKLRRRLGSAFLAVLMLLSLLPMTAFAADEGATEVKTESELITAVANGGVIKLTDNITLTKQLTITKEVTLDGQNHKISVGDTFQGKDAISVAGADNVTIQNLTLNGNQKAGYGIQFYKADNGKIANVTVTGNTKAGLNVNASVVSAEGTIDLTGNTKSTINVGFGQSISNAPGASLDVSKATLTGVTSIYADSGDVSRAKDAKVEIEVKGIGDTFAAIGDEFYKPICYELKETVSKTAKITVEDGNGEVVYYKYATSLSKAVSNATEGATVTLAQGNYNGPLNITERVNLIGAGADKTTINGPIQYKFSEDQKGATVTVQGLTVKAPDNNGVQGLQFCGDKPNDGYNVTINVKDCAFDGWTYGVTMNSHANGYNMTVSNCDFTNSVYAVSYNYDETTSGQIAKNTLKFEGNNKIAENGFAVQKFGNDPTDKNYDKTFDTIENFEKNKPTIEGTVKYVKTADELKNAVANAKDGDTIVFGENIELDSTLQVQKDVILYLNGKTLKYTGKTPIANPKNGVNLVLKNGAVTSDTIGAGANSFVVGENGELTFDGIVFTTSGNGVVLFGDNAKANIKNSTITSDSWAVATRGGSNLVINVENSTISATEDGFKTAMLVNQEGTKLIMSDSVVNGYGRGVVVRDAGTVEIKNTEINNTVNSDKVLGDGWNSGDGVPAGALVIGDGLNGKKCDANVKLDGVTINVGGKYGDQTSGIYLWKDEDDQCKLETTNSVVNGEVTMAGSDAAVTDFKTVRYVSVGEEIEDFSVSKGTEITLISAPSRPGYTFMGWAANGTLYKAGDLVEIKADTTFTAQWSDNTPYYAITVEPADNGTVTCYAKSAAKGATVTVKVKPDVGYQLDKLVVTDAKGNVIEVKQESYGTYTFVMPGSKVTVEGVFVKTTPETLPFTDVKPTDWFYNSVKYVYENGLMNGVENNQFAPNTTLNRAMMVTILYRLDGQPAVSGDVSFTDVPAGTWYTNAVKWASDNGIVNGMEGNKFAPNGDLTREQMAAILYRYAEYKKLDVSASADLTTFVDGDKTSAWAADAMKWAVGAELINGLEGNTLAPQGTSTRAQVATVLMRFCENIVK